MSLITPTQSREARRELGISQADVATAIGFNRAYLSDFESGNLTRLTKSQLRKLRAHYEEKIAAAREAGEEIEIAFGEGGPTVATISVGAVSKKQVLIAAQDDVSEEVVASVMATIADNDKALVPILNAMTSRESGLFGPGEFSDETLDNIREAFSLLSCNYLLIRSVGGWPELGLSASNMNIAENSVVDLIVKGAMDCFVKSGVIDAESEVIEGEEVAA